MKNTTRLVGSLTTALVLLLGGSAFAENREHAGPKFSCAVTVREGGDSTVTIKKIGGGATDPDHDVVAIVLTPKDKVDAVTCGRALEKEGSETKVGVSLIVKKGFPYTCTASQTNTTFQCNPVR
jgi:hypothetical protein